MHTQFLNVSKLFVLILASPPAKYIILPKPETGLGTVSRNFYSSTDKMVSAIKHLQFWLVKTAWRASVECDNLQPCILRWTRMFFVFLQTSRCNLHMEMILGLNIWAVLAHNLKCVSQSSSEVIPTVADLIHPL